MSVDNKINFVFIGNFTFPNGKAGTQRLKRVIEALVSLGNPCIVLLFSSRYFTVGETYDMDSEKALVRKSFFNRALTLYRLKSSELQNVLYVYNGISVQNILTACVARLLGYKLLVDIVEGFLGNPVEGNFHLGR